MPKPRNSKKRKSKGAPSATHSSPRRSKRLKTTTKDTSETNIPALGAPTTPSSSRSSRSSCRLEELLDTPNVSHLLVKSTAPWVHSEPRNDDQARVVTTTDTTNAIKAKDNLKWFRGMCKDFSDNKKRTGKSKDKRGHALAKWKYDVGSYKYAMANNTETSHRNHTSLKHWDEKYDEALSEFGIELNYTPPHLHVLCVSAEDEPARAILANNKILETKACRDELHEIWQTFVDKHKYKSSRPGARPSSIRTGMKMLFYGMRRVKVKGEEKLQRKFNLYPMKFILYDFDRNELARFKIARAYGQDTHDDNTSSASNEDSENGDDDDNNSENDEDDEIENNEVVYPVGFKFQRFFPGYGWHEATVEHIFPGRRYVVYSDDDNEGMTIDEISKSIKAWEKRCQDNESNESNTSAIEIANDISGIDVDARSSTFKVNDYCYARDEQSGADYYAKAKIIDIKENEIGGSEYLIHFHGWNKRYDRWMDGSNLFPFQAAQNSSASRSITNENVDSSIWDESIPFEHEGNSYANEAAEDNVIGATDPSFDTTVDDSILDDDHENVGEVDDSIWDDDHENVEVNEMLSSLAIDKLWVSIAFIIVATAWIILK